MPFNGAGGFTVYTPGNPAVPGTAISSAAFNATMADFAAGLVNTLTRDGQSPATANIPMGGNKLTGLGAATGVGQAILFDQLAASSGASLVGYLPAGAGAVATTVQAKLRESVSVKDFGAVGDNATDNNIAFTKALAYCTTNNKALLIPSGIYLVSDIFSGIACSMIGEGKPVIRNTNISVLATDRWMFLFQSASNIVIDGIIFDGQVSANTTTFNTDPVWAPSTYNTFYGVRGVYLNQCTNGKVTNCVFSNFEFSGLRIEASTNIDVAHCRTNRNRGTFGDGTYVANSAYVTFNACKAYDFTRIGFVTEAGTAYVKFSDCFSKYGHDRSSLYGGGEYNGGFWFEKSANITAVNCNAENTGYFGFQLVPQAAAFNQATPVPPYSMSVIGCNVVDTPYGISCLASVAESMILVQSCNVAFDGTNGGTGIHLQGGQDAYVLVESCSVTVNGDIPAACITVGAQVGNGVVPVYKISNCTLGHTTVTATNARIAAASTSYVGEITQFTQYHNAYSLIIENCIASSPDGLLLVNKLQPNFAQSYQSPVTIIRNTPSVYYNDLSAEYNSTLTLENNTFAALIAYAKTFKISECTFNAGIALTYANPIATYPNTINNCNFLAPQNLIQYTGWVGASGFIGFLITNCFIRGDLSATNSFLLDIRKADPTGNRMGYVMDLCRFVNDSTNGPSSCAIYEPYSDQMNTAAGGRNFFDSTITNVRSIGALRVLETDPITISYGVRMTLPT